MSKYAEKELDEPVWGEVLTEWERVLTGLEQDPMSLADTLDWVAKLRLLEGYRSRDGQELDSPRARALDLQYHDIDPEKGLYNRLAARGSMRRLFTDDELDEATVQPPTNTRAFFRGRCVSQFSGALVAANWDSLVFDIGEPHLKRVPMMEPLRGTKEMVDQVLQDAETAAELLELIGG
jgi:proteasome accessory factor A